MTPRFLTSRRRRPVAVGAVAALALLVAGTVAGCSSSPDPANSGAANAGGQTITLYNAQHEQTTDALVAAFTAQTGIKVRVVSDDEDVLTAQIEAEGARS